MAGIRAEFVFQHPGDCPVAAASNTVEGSVRDVSWTAQSEGTVAEQFSASAEPSLDGVEPVFDYGSRGVYEVERSANKPCICEFIEQEVGPVTEVHAREGDLHVTIHASEMTDLRELIGELQDSYGDIRIEYLVRGKTDAEESDLVPVDMRRLTARQQEVLATAHEMGYFDYPREANASDVADALDIGPSTFIEHLNAAQSKLLDELLLEA